MKQEHLKTLGEIPQPPKEYCIFRDEPQKPAENFFRSPAAVLRERP